MIIIAKRLSFLKRKAPAAEGSRALRGARSFDFIVEDGALDVPFLYDEKPPVWVAFLPEKALGGKPEFV